LPAPKRAIFIANVAWFNWWLSSCLN
jgi:hypothetical protein